MDKIKSEAIPLSLSYVKHLEKLLPQLEHKAEGKKFRVKKGSVYSPEGDFIEENETSEVKFVQENTVELQQQAECSGMNQRHFELLKRLLRKMLSSSPHNNNDNSPLDQWTETLIIRNAFVFMNALLDRSIQTSKRSTNSTVSISLHHVMAAVYLLDCNQETKKRLIQAIKLDTI
eukprot:TRINITY_DN6167_c0_g1_i1.p1 TRINITY_DN6167_c0_g1~~TRINITY_DN6167_c0_g1_i1.p1  ORF type:complete len:175 (-),score=15.96 TRINITY_DN6167_c0_g1_i1:121-645(-)